MHDNAENSIINARTYTCNYSACSNSQSVGIMECRVWAVASLLSFIF